MLPGGDLLVVGAEPSEWSDGGPRYRIADEARYVLRFDWTGRLLWKRNLPSHDDIEVTPDGKLLLLTFQRRRDPKLFPLEPVKPSTLGGPIWVDVFHSNSVEWMHHKHLLGKHPIYGLDNILVCFRHQDCVAVLNWSRNQVVWVWGQNQVAGPPSCA